MMLEVVPGAGDDGSPGDHGRLGGGHRGGGGLVRGGGRRYRPMPGHGLWLRVATIHWRSSPLRLVSGPA